MPRVARKESRSNIYHVMMRGVNRQVIFQDDRDRRFFMATMQRCRELSQFRLHAFCLMPNHIHLLIEPGEESLEIVFKRIGVSYAQWYNNRHGRVGHLFQDRFRSENVETDAYFMTALRYILLNPVKAGIVSRPEEYTWSSCRAYISGKGSLTDTQFALDLFGSRERLTGFLAEANQDVVMDEDQLDPVQREDREAEMMLRITGCRSAAEFQQLDRKQQKAHVRELYLAGLTGPRIHALTGVPTATIYRIVNAAGAEGQTPVLCETDISEFEYTFDQIW